MGKQVIPTDGLTEDQQKALNGYFNNPKKLFYGTSLKNAVENLRLVNKLREEGKNEKANKQEGVWFYILGFGPKVEI